MSRKIWTQEEVSAIYNQPFMDLVFQAATIHRQNHDPQEIQVSTLLSIKTGGCVEDCAYCSQAARYQTGVKVEKLMKIEAVLASAQRAKDAGSSRFCMGAAWREVRDNRDFDAVIDMVKGINELGMEVCCTLGMLTESQAERLKEAGLYAYNHNLDTSAEHYSDVITTRTYDDRLKTLNNVRKANISVCSGGILGLGETKEDVVSMLITLANLPKYPESVPINNLVPIKGTPLAEQKNATIFEMVRTIATARILMPKTMVRLSAGRLEMTQEGQTLCFLAGANSIFSGDTLLTTPNPSVNNDKTLFQLLQLKQRAAFKHEEVLM
jgi:biotin synthase